MSNLAPESINKIALGTVQFGLDYGISNKEGKTSSGEVEKILIQAERFDIDLLDTAYAYGSSEKVLGDLLAGFKFKIVSKFPTPQQGKTIKSYIQESLSLLKVKTLYAYMAHDAQCILDDLQLWRQLLELREEGIVSKIGYSLYSTPQLRKLVDSGCKPDIVQVPYNVFDRRFETEFELLKTMGTEIHVRSVFLQGLFFMKPEELPSYFDEAKPLLKKMQFICPEKQTLGAALINFCLKNPFVDRVVIGVNNVAQLSSNILNLSLSLPSFNWDDFNITDESILLPYQWPKIHS
jgi:aryl-alcohol dehydrogenase-like predicted oxidoreductase